MAREGGTYKEGKKIHETEKRVMPGMEGKPGEGSKTATQKEQVKPVAAIKRDTEKKEAST